MGAGLELAAVLVHPRLGVVVTALEHDRARVPVLGLAPHVVPALEHEDALAGGGERVGERATPSSRADDDDVVVAVAGHGLLLLVHLSWASSACLVSARGRFVTRRRAVPGTIRPHGVL